jgi:hypoxanthine phosphoribosyltransferase
MKYSDWPGFRPGDLLYADYNRIYAVVCQLEDQLGSNRPEIVVGVLRGGAIPALMFATRLALPVAFLAYDRGNPKPSLFSSVPLAGKRVLLVDDFASSGQTLGDTKAFLCSEGASPTTCTLFHDPKRTTVIPDISLPAERFVLFPWEQRVLSPATQKIIREKDGKIAPAQEQHFFGIDLDGVLTDDLRRRWYRKKPLQALLKLRDSLKARGEVPAWRAGSAVVITGRPQEDFDRTRQWLDENGFADLALCCRDPAVFGDSLLEAARYKAAKIREVGVTVFYESDLKQAIAIAEACPFVDVIWWGKKKRLRLTVSPQA